MCPKPVLWLHAVPNQTSPPYGRSLSAPVRLSEAAALGLMVPPEDLISPLVSATERTETAEQWHALLGGIGSLLGPIAQCQVSAMSMGSVLRLLSVSIAPVTVIATAA